VPIEEEEKTILIQTMIKLTRQGVGKEKKSDSRRPLEEHS